MSSQPIIVYFDGLCQPVNPGGIATYAFVIRRGEQILVCGSGIAGEPFSPAVSNNVAEYTALIQALRWLLDAGCQNEKIIVRGDSQLVIYQIRGLYQVKASRLVPLYQQVKELLKQFSYVVFAWIPREMNKEADELSNQVYREYLNKHPELVDRIKPYLATSRQIEYLQKLGIMPPPFLSRIEALALIKHAQRSSPRHNRQRLNIKKF